ncbi:hypothetical protein FGB62_292g08 [Gracilaria domingensis]|nr:hypothetical protein FGB62_292g08 [Gracilaria domingensis]
MVNARCSSRRTTTTGEISQSSEQTNPGLKVDFLVVLENGAKEVVGHATKLDDNGSLKTFLHGSELEAVCIVIYLTEIRVDGTLPYPHTFEGIEGPPGTFSDIFRTATVRTQPATAEAQPASVAGLVVPKPQHDSTAELGDVKDDIHVISSSNEDVVEVKRSNRTETKRRKNILDLNRRSIDLTDYTQRPVTIDITRTKKPEQTLLGMSESHKVDLILNFRKPGLFGALGLMSVAVALEMDMKNALNNEDRVLLDCVIIDGPHRLMEVMLWGGTDGQHVSTSEVLRLGALFDEDTEGFLKMRFGDKFHSTVSLIKVLEKEHSLSASELDSQQVGKCLQSSNLISGAEKKQYMRSADLASKLVNTPGMVEKFEHMCEHNSKIALTLFSHTELCKLEAYEF